MYFVLYGLMLMEVLDSELYLSYRIFFNRNNMVNFIIFGIWRIGAIYV